ncbi:hypothetical protein QBC46DRAFT_446836 [Diplogelasinospora grovesii]|uniref:Uncharacterized protein n=1 Tax=Diplogelasinospora grovesii TaxID=303347 RepID=A0AAN6NG12_9PEZI|nr:hypothetical protein QBC46DRAFT_446836 [Diplogelasinospora grovesii]
MAYLSLTTRDIHVLEKIKDPESDPSSAVQIDAAQPKDPHVLDDDVYRRVSQQEREIVQSMQDLELQLAGLRPRTTTDVTGAYRKCVSRLGSLIQEHPEYASARNNRAQALRRLCGDSMLVTGAQQNATAQVSILHDLNDAERLDMAKTALCDLDRTISLLTPTGPRPRLSPQAARTLSNAHTQRAAIYHMTSKLISSSPSPLSVDPGRREAGWTKLEFEENASRDFALGGRYGNEIAKGLAVSTNPTAKLCGQMVREAMKKEYGPDFGV